MSAARKEAQRKPKEEKKKMKEDEKRIKQEMKKGGPRGGRGAAVGQPSAGPIKSIGTPFNFSHDTHVGWDASRGFELRNIPQDWVKLFRDAGATQADLEDPETRAMLVATMQNSMGAPAPPPPPSAPAPPPAPMPPPAPGAPPPPSLSMSAPAAPAAPADPYTAGTSLKAIWSEDGQWYNAIIESVRQEGGVKLYLVTFTDYGNQEEVPVESLEPRAAPAPAPAGPPAKMDMASMLAARAGSLKSTEERQLTPKETENIVDSVKNALAARRAGMCFSVYGHDAVTDDEEWKESENDESWMDF
eukprot:TRINITY_DN900_c0_g1_i1.p1 TRINITY_DN900_c0_g1~~TRINITY_DN900_c0_g1_i1.p1  ORF type:complete len:302 (-),score=74.82 TRINITY_DN900_c0_g1_i1:141-1046(-)